MPTETNALTIDVARQGHVTVVSLGGEIDLATQGELRTVLNEDEVIALLESRGFETLTMEGPVRAQAATFASAEAIVAAHGAALANLVFAPPGTAVVELMGRNTASQLVRKRRAVSFQDSTLAQLARNQVYASVVGDLPVAQGTISTTTPHLEQSTRRIA